MVGSLLHDLMKDKIVLITGASSGIGKTIATDLSQFKLKSLIIVSRNEAGLNELATTIKDRSVDVIPLVCDISSKEEVRNMSNTVLQKFGYIDILINNAGIGIFGKVNETSIEEIEKVNNTNYFGMIYCTKFFLDSMIKRNTGYIINIASLAASFGIPGMAAYCGSKFALLGFSESLKHELRNTGIKISVISPIGVKTNFFNNKYFNYKIPMKYALKPEKVSKAVMNSFMSSSFQIFVPSFSGLTLLFKYLFPAIVDLFIEKQFNKKFSI